MRKGARPDSGNLVGLILSVLEATPLHGYAIAREIEQRSADALSYGEGSLYPALKKLEGDGHIVGSWDTGGPANARRIYRITPTGLAELASIREAWVKHTASVERVLMGQVKPRTA